LAEELAKGKYRVTLRARLAELPTETSIGMNAIAPVERGGRLRAVVKNGGIAGFAAGEFAVTDPTSRVRAIAERSARGEALDLELGEFQELSVTQLKRRMSQKAGLVVVRSLELDKAGETGMHLGTFEHTLSLLKSALSLLHQAGVEQFVITSDHGFLLQDGTVENVAFGAHMGVPERRHAFLKQPSGMPDVLEVRLSDLEYDAPEDHYLVFRPDTAVWQTKAKVPPFVHGGNSLQERVVPVLLLDRHVVPGRSTSKYEVVARAEPAHLGRQRLRLAVRLQAGQTGALGFVAPKAIHLALRVPGRPDVAINLLDAGPPAALAEGRVVLPPNRDEAVVEFELVGEIDKKVRVEV
ncbi:MAG: PglZ domain-containing protein, partial [Polyangiaceae bacterium]|nr:PglZ domain-containing protein [Polyangiaceae bacterium]